MKYLSLLFVLLFAGCAQYKHSRDATGKETTFVGSFLMTSKASKITSAVKDGEYSRRVGVGAIEAAGDSEMLKAMIQAAFEAGMEAGKKSHGIP